MAALFKKLLNLIHKQPEESPESHGVEESQISTPVADTDYSTVTQSVDNTLLSLFAVHVKNKPGQIALVYKNDQLSYRQLNERANQFAHYLQQKGVKKETLVPVCIERSIEMMVAILGILKAGAVYVPIDPEFQSERIKFILQDTGAGIIAGNAKSKEKILAVNSQLDVIALDSDWSKISQMPLTDPSNNIAPQDLAYIIYTSGSTGNPKGVMVEHKSIYSYLLVSREKFIKEGENGSGTFIHIPYTFDASLKSILTPLVSGKLSVISSEPSPLVFEDSNLHKYAPYDFIQLTPSHLEFFFAEFKDRFDKAMTRKISVGGEALYLSHFADLIDEGESLDVVNEYGPTEATVACTAYYFNINEADAPHTVPIGKAIKGVDIYILNENNEPVAEGESGEICVGGAQVARGYLNQPELTQQKFIPDTFSGSTGASIYKTGDMGRVLPDGNIEYLGRIDKQVKIRGHRIELGEIESVLIKSEAIKNIAVEARENKLGDKQLVAYIVPNRTFDKQEILDYLQDKVPYYMVPEKWVEMESLPVTTNGKIDRKALPDPK